MVFRKKFFHPCHPWFLLRVIRGILAEVSGEERGRVFWVKMRSLALLSNVGMFAALKIAAPRKLETDELHLQRHAAAQRRAHRLRRNAAHAQCDRGRVGRSRRTARARARGRHLAFHRASPFQRHEAAQPAADHCGGRGRGRLPERVHDRGSHMLLREGGRAAFRARVRCAHGHVRGFRLRKGGDRSRARGHPRGDPDVSRPARAARAGASHLDAVAAASARAPAHGHGRDGVAPRAEGDHGISPEQLQWIEHRRDGCRTRAA